MKYQIVSDGSCDLPQELVKKKNIAVVPFYVSFDEKSYKKEKEEISVREFYEEMVQNPKVFPKSSMPSVQDYVDVFMPITERGEAVICICITTKFSGSMQSALNARDVVQETYPEAEITIIDATVNTVLQGIYVLEAVKLKENGVPYEKAVEILEKIKSTGRIFFTVGSIDYLKHGGRIGKLAGITASTLGIKPMITLKEGEIFPSGIARGRKSSMIKVVKLLTDYIDESKLPFEEYTIAAGYGYDYREASEFHKYVQKTLTERYGKETVLPLFQIGATIGVHTGPYPIGIGIMKKSIPSKYEPKLKK